MTGSIKRIQSMSACTIFRGLTLFSRFGNGDYLNRVSLRSSEDASPLLPHLRVNSPTLCTALYLVSFRVLPMKKMQSMSACTIFRGLTLFSRFGNGDYLNRVSLRSSEDASPLLPHLGVNSPTLCTALYLVSFRVLPMKKMQSMSECTIFRGLTLFSRFGNGDYLDRVSLRSSEDASPLLPHLGVNSPTLCIALYSLSFSV